LELQQTSSASPPASRRTRHEHFLRLVKEEDRRGVGVEDLRDALQCKVGICILALVQEGRMVRDPP
jgi:hypothetical protein